VNFTRRPASFSKPHKLSHRLSYTGIWHTEALRKPSGGTQRPFPHPNMRMQSPLHILGRLSHTLTAVFSMFVLLLSLGPTVGAQESGSGPLEPPPEHKITRVVGGITLPVAPPSLPPAEIIRNFTQREDSFAAARPLYAYRRTVRIQEFGLDGKPSGEYLSISDAIRSGDGKIYERSVSAPQSTLEMLQFAPDDVHALLQIPPFPVTTSQLSKYNVVYLNTETVDEVECYIFQVSPKTLDRRNPLFDGVIWVDQKYLEVVKTYGKWVTDLGEFHPASLPFSTFETYRENVDGKYWLPDYARADGSIKLKDRDVPIRVTIKWTNYKPFPPTAAPVAAPTPSAPAPSPPPTKP
jgi:hypothetical protein